MLDHIQFSLIHDWFLCNIVLYSIRFYFHCQSHPQLCVVLLCLHLFILSGVISPLISSSIVGPCQPGEFIVQCLMFCLFILFMWFSRQQYRSVLPFPSPVDHILSELSTMTHPSWMALHGLAHGFTELHKPLCRDKVVIHEGDTPGILLQFVFYSTLYLLRPIHINPYRENSFILFI